MHACVIKNESIDWSLSPDRGVNFFKLFSGIKFINWLFLIFIALTGENILNFDMVVTVSSFSLFNFLIALSIIFALIQIELHNRITIFLISFFLSTFFTASNIASDNKDLSDAKDFGLSSSSKLFFFAILFITSESEDT